MEKISLSLCGLLMTLAPHLYAENMDGSNSPASCCYDLSTDAAFQKGGWEVGIDSGVMFSPFVFNVQKRTVHYTTSGIQVGYMLDNPDNTGWLRGNFEVVNEVFGDGVFEGRGSYVVGDTIWIRYNFVPAGWKLKPYVQMGGGVEWTDIDRRILGQDFNFNLNLAGGVRYMITPRCSLNLEYRYQHFSDAGMSKVNLGVNAQGVVLGISWLF